MTDEAGIPLAVMIAGANVPDAQLAMPTLDAVPLRAHGRPRRPLELCLDKGYDYPRVDKGLARRRVHGHIARRGQKPKPLPRWKKPRRWVVERTNAWHNRLRGLLVRWERKGAHYLALCLLGSVLITHQQTLAWLARN